MSVERSPMTEEERSVAKALGDVVYPMGTFAKRFAKSIVDTATTSWAEGLSLKQRETMYQIAWTYRRQLPASVRELIPTIYRH